MNGGTGVWVDENRRRRFKPLEAQLMAHAYEHIGVGVGLYNQIKDAFKPVGRGIDWKETLNFLDDWDKEPMNKEELDAKWHLCELEFGIDREPKEFRPMGELNNVQKKVRKKTNRKKKRRR